MSGRQFYPGGGALMATEFATANGLTVARYRIIGTDILVYSAWEATARDGVVMYGHSTVSRGDDGVMLGRVGTRNLPSELNAMPAYTVERVAAVHDFHQAQYAEAYAAIVEAFPQAADGWQSGGEITGAA